MNLSFRKHLPLLLTTALSLFLLSATLVLAQAGSVEEASQFSKGIQTVLWAIVNNVFGFLVGLSGLVLDYAITNFVVGFGDQFLNRGVGAAVDQLWVMVRDIFNLTFVFGLVWIGFRMILNSDDSNTRRWLIYLILAALLVNFSLFITKFIVDFTNLLATEIVNATFGSNSISETFMQIIGLSSAFDTSGWNSEAVSNNILNGGSQGYGYIFGALFIFLIAAFVFFAGGIVLIIRFIALSLYMILSPLMFLGWVFPQLQSITSQYWRGFLGRAFYAPVYVLLISFSVVVITNLQTSFGSPNFGTALSGTGSAMNNSTFESTFIPFILAAGFLIASIIVGGKMSADGASTMIRVGNNINGRIKRGAQRAAVRTAKTAAAPAAVAGGMAARRTSYALGTGLERQLEKMQNADKNSRMGRAARSVGGMVAVDEAVRGRSTKLKDAKYGLSNTVEEERKKKAAIQSRVTATDTIRDGAAASRPELNSIDSDKIYDPASDSIVEKTSLSAAALAAAETAQAEREKQKAAMVDKLNSMSAKDMETFMQAQPQIFNDAIGSLNDSNFEKLASSENLNADQVKKLYGVREKALKDSLSENGIKIASAYERLSTKQIELLGDEFIRENAEMFNQDQLDGIKKSEKFTPTQKEAYKAARKNRIKNVLASGPSDEVESLFRPVTGTFDSVDPRTGRTVTARRINPGKYKKATEIAALPYEALIDRRVNSEIPVDAVRQIGRDFAAGKSPMNAAEVDNLYTALQTNGTPEVQAYLSTAKAQRDFKGTV